MVLKFNLGGFENLPFSDTDHYPSELADDGYVTWQKVTTNPDGTVGPLLYPTIRWEFNMRPFGWTMLHHITYFRTRFEVPFTGTWLITFDNILSFKIDNHSFIGNVYGYKHASENSVFLEAGTHHLYVHTTMDVRLYGGGTPPNVKFSGRFRFLNDIDPDHGIVPYLEDTILPELMDGYLITPYASVTVKNGLTSPLTGVKPSRLMQNEPGWKLIRGVTLTDGTGRDIPSDIRSLQGIKLAPGQTFPIPIQITFNKLNLFPTSIRIQVDMLDLDTGDAFKVDFGVFSLKNRSWGQGFKMTHLGYDFSIQYAMVKPPRQPCSSSRAKCPIVVALHGAGVEVNSDFWVSAVNQQNYAWVVFPTGRTSW